MARMPSHRRSFKEEGMELNLTPMMNLIAILIPALLVSTVFVEIAVLNVAAPAIGTNTDSSQDDTPPDKPPLNLTVTVTDKGYTIAATGAVLHGEGAEGETKGPTIPIVQKQVSCTQFLGTWPPPRAKNRNSAKCKKGEDKRTFWIYDARALQNKLVEIKDENPDERRIIIAAEPDTEFEAITDVMDASREKTDEASETRTLFDEVVLSPGLS